MSECEQAFLADSFWQLSNKSGTYFKTRDAQLKSYGGPQFFYPRAKIDMYFPVPLAFLSNTQGEWGLQAELKARSGHIWPAGRWLCFRLKLCCYNWMAFFAKCSALVYKFWWNRTHDFTFDRDSCQRRRHHSERILSRASVKRFVTFLGESENQRSISVDSEILADFRKLSVTTWMPDDLRSRIAVGVTSELNPIPKEDGHICRTDQNFWRILWDLGEQIHQ